jgi:hypothetical protein
MANTDGLTSRLPREQEHVTQASQEWRLSVGVKAGNSVKKLGYWMLTRRHRETGGKCIYVKDEAMQALLETKCSDAQPKVLPCSLIGNPVEDELRPGHLTMPDSIIFREIAMFGAGRRLCYCQNPDAPKPLAHRAVQEQVTRSGKTFKQITGYQELPCSRDNPDKPCQAFSADPPKCKPHIIVPLYLPWSGSTGACVYRTTGWTAFDSMLDSLTAIAHMTGGWLHGLPLELVYEERQVGINQYWVPAPRFRLVTTDARAALAAGKDMRQLMLADGGAERLQARSETVRAGITATLADPVEQRETQEEFWPGAGAEDCLDGEFEELPADGAPTASEVAAIKAEEAAAYERDFGEGRLP